MLDNIALAMERVDIEMNTPIGIEEDVASQDEIQALIEKPGHGVDARGTRGQHGDAHHGSPPTWSTARCRRSTTSASCTPS